MFGSNVAPRRKVNDKKNLPWECRCEHKPRRDEDFITEKVNPGYLVRCTDCKTERP